MFEQGHLVSVVDTIALYSLLARFSLSSTLICVYTFLSRHELGLIAFA